MFASPRTRSSSSTTPSSRNSRKDGEHPPRPEWPVPPGSDLLPQLPRHANAAVAHGGGAPTHPRPPPPPPTTGIATPPPRRKPIRRMYRYGPESERAKSPSSSVIS